MRLEAAAQSVGCGIMSRIGFMERPERGVKRGIHGMGKFEKGNIQAAYIWFRKTIENDNILFMHSYQISTVFVSILYLGCIHSRLGIHPFMHVYIS